ncbi:fungal specific transcription factor [Cryptococcus wingfieldii CBS 7118]|uniref:Fungal specific transcription factor n=1 Tax=Cryptococcus wingfieldii CBS 7118 TaxID=1295528 RepID=A0A1E3IXT6_9TREE|nr:fungal specific transcription factor [Cryptococcus wingfieldii CBS 7118]ODN93409.1 fungal specific transcription factor [Cryptococcus wingfieldii CBS 7118]
MKAPTQKNNKRASYSPYPPADDKPIKPPPLPRTQSVASSSRASQPPTPSAASDAQSYKVARAISSCTRCRTRKQKCDGKLPACTSCDRAGVECIGFDAISKTNISRNYLHQLEEEVAVLRAQISALSSVDPIGERKRNIAANSSHAVSNYFPEFPGENGPSRDGRSPRSPFASPVLPSNNGHQQRRYSDFPYPSTPISADPPRSPFTSSRPHPTGQPASLHATSLTRMVHDAALRTGHAANSGITSGSNASGSDRGSTHGGTIDSPMSAELYDHHISLETLPTPTSAIPRLPPSASGPVTLSVSSGGKPRRKVTIPPLPPQGAVEKLVAAYVDFVGVTGPIIHIPTLGRQLSNIRGGLDVEESDIFVVMMVLALSTMASSRFVDPPDDLRACSEAFHAEAIKHLDAVFEGQSYVGLQAILLLVWYSLLNPDKGSIWFLIGLATRTCVDMGYHNEHNIPVDQLDALELDMRRRLFWCTYKMDRLLSQSLGRPPSIPDGFINVPLPSDLHDIDIHSGHYGPMTGEPCSYKAVFIHTTKLRQLQSEVLFNTYGVHSSTGRLPSQEWVDDCYERLQDWLKNAPEPRGAVSTEGYALSYHNSCLLLFRPSPGCPRPGRKALSIVLSSSGYNIRIYRRMQLNNRISWLWMTSHFSFMAGLSFLYAFSNLYSLGGGEDVPTIEDAMMTIESCLGVLEFLAPRVPSASACHDTMRTLSQAIFKQLGEFNPPPVSNTSGSPAQRTNFRSVPISSSREDPLPNEVFPAPLPPVTMPYEMSLLDNLFRNPMASHNKASDYTSNKQCGKRAHVGVDGYSHAPGGMPPRAFHSAENGHHAPYTPTSTNGVSSSIGDPNTLMGTFGMAAHINMSPVATSPVFPASDGPSLNTLANTAAAAAASAGSQSTDERISAIIHGRPNNGTGNGTAFGENDGAFDVFSFLMDEEGGLGSNGYSEVPADFSLWG